MRCAWKELLSILPLKMREDVNRLGRDTLLELRLRINAPPELIRSDGNCWLTGNVTQDTMDFIINTASQYSPWTATTISQGYLTALGGHRIGICGEVILCDGIVTGIRKAYSLCIRVARDHLGVWKTREPIMGSVLILGAPGWGKTTLLRDLIRNLSESETVSVIDERGELFPDGFQQGKRMDLLTGCPKAIGIERAIRTMGPECVAVDEITSEEDCRALLRAAYCGVRLAATAHAASIQDFSSRRVYQMLIENRIFQTFLVLNRDKAYTLERMTQ